MLIKKTGIVTTLVFFIGCAGAPKPPNCNNSKYVKRVNPEWVSEVAEYSIPWDNEQDIKKEKLETIKSIKKRSKPFKKGGPKKVKNLKELIEAPKDLMDKMVFPSKTGSLWKKGSIMQPIAQQKPSAPINVSKNKKKKAKLPTKAPSSAERKALEQRMQQNKERMPLPPKSNPPSYLTPVKGPREENIKTTALSPPSMEFLSPQEDQAHKNAFVLHVGSYKNIKNALKQQKKLFKAGFPVYIRSLDVNKTPYHRVFVGPNLSKNEATNFKKELDSYINVKIYSSKNRFVQ